jgi:hypothetical protein
VTKQERKTDGETVAPRRCGVSGCPKAEGDGNDPVAASERAYGSSQTREGAKKSGAVKQSMETDSFLRSETCERQMEGHYRPRADRTGEFRNRCCSHARRGL